LSVFTAEDSTNIPQPANIFGKLDSDRLLNVEFTMEDVKARLASLREDKSPGADDLSPRLLKRISEEIAYPVTILFNQSMNEGAVPHDWKIANVTPIFKKGSRR